MGGLTFLQVVVAGTAMWLCRDNLEILDNVALFPSMFKEFTGSTHDRTEEVLDSSNASIGGCFVREGDADRYRWVFFKSEKHS